ncbi:MAG: hypothetical protein Q7R96_02665 [Nanoarchaeota archaeon]|nr:hypothetical protein [Nanoarchaeota archaeon]
MVFCPQCKGTNVTIKHLDQKLGRTILHCNTCNHEWTAGTTDITKIH